MSLINLKIARWGDKLVLVAKLEHRIHTLLGSKCTVEDLSIGCFVILETIAKYRYNGVPTIGFAGLFSCGLSSGTIWYAKQKLLSLGLITTQQLNIKPRFLKTLEAFASRYNCFTSVSMTFKEATEYAQEIHSTYTSSDLSPVEFANLLLGPRIEQIKGSQSFAFLKLVKSFSLNDWIASCNKKLGKTTNQADESIVGDGDDKLDDDEDGDDGVEMDQDDEVDEKQQSSDKVTQQPPASMRDIRRMLCDCPKTVIGLPVLVQAARLIQRQPLTIFRLAANLQLPFFFARRLIRALHALFLIKPIKHSVHTTFVIEWHWLSENERLAFANQSETQRAKRTQFIVDYLAEHKVVDSRSTLTQIIRDHEASQGLKAVMDRKSLLRIINDLVKSNQMVFRGVKVLGKEMQMICHPSVTDQDEFLALKIKQLESPSTTSKVLPATREKPHFQTTVSSTINWLPNMDRKLLVRLVQSLLHGILTPIITVPKHRRRSVFHQFLYYLVYELKSDAKPVSPATDLYPPAYTSDNAWYRFIPPLPRLKDHPSGWFMLMDVIERMPLGLFLVTQSAAYLPRFLARLLTELVAASNNNDDPRPQLDLELSNDTATDRGKKRKSARSTSALEMSEEELMVPVLASLIRSINYVDFIKLPLTMLPLPDWIKGHLYAKLTCKSTLRTFSGRFDELARANLVSIKVRDEPRHMTCAYLHRRVPLLDTRGVGRGHYFISPDMIKTECPNEPVKFELTDLGQLALYWFALERIARATPLIDRPRERRFFDIQPGCSPSFDRITFVQSPADIVDDGRLPSCTIENPGCGAGGMHATDLIHRRIGWGSSRLVAEDRQGDQREMIGKLLPPDMASQLSFELIWPWFFAMFDYSNATLPPNLQIDMKPVTQVAKPTYVYRTRVKNSKRILVPTRMKLKRRKPEPRKEELVQRLRCSWNSLEDRLFVICRAATVVITGDSRFCNLCVNFAVLVDLYKVLFPELIGVKDVDSCRRRYRFIIFLKQSHAVEARLLVNQAFARTDIANKFHLGRQRWYTWLREKPTEAHLHFFTLIDRLIDDFPPNHLKRLKTKMGVTPESMFAAFASEHSIGDARLSLQMSPPPTSATTTVTTTVVEKQGETMPAVVKLEEPEPVEVKAVHNRGESKATNDNIEFCNDDEPVEQFSSRAELESMFKVISLIESGPTGGGEFKTNWTFHMGLSKTSVAVYALYNYIMASFPFPGQPQWNFNKELFCRVLRQYPQQSVNEAVDMLMKNTVMIKWKTVMNSSITRMVNGKVLALSSLFKHRIQMHENNTRHIPIAWQLMRQIEATVTTPSPTTLQSSNVSPISVPPPNSVMDPMVSDSPIIPLTSLDADPETSLFVDSATLTSLVNNQSPMEPMESDSHAQNPGTPSEEHLAVTPINDALFASVAPESSIIVLNHEFARQSTHPGLVALSVELLFKSDIFVLTYCRPDQDIRPLFTDSKKKRLSNICQPDFTVNSGCLTVVTASPKFKAVETLANSFPDRQDHELRLPIKFSKLRRASEQLDHLQQLMSNQLQEAVTNSRIAPAKRRPTDRCSSLEKFIRSGQAVGRSCAEIKTKFGDTRTTSDKLNVLLDNSTIYQLGITSTQFVHKSNIRLWLVNAKTNYKRTAFQARLTKVDEGSNPSKVARHDQQEEADNHQISSTSLVDKNNRDGDDDSQQPVDSTTVNPTNEDMSPSSTCLTYFFPEPWVSEAGRIKPETFCSFLNALAFESIQSAGVTLDKFALREQNIFGCQNVKKLVMILHDLGAVRLVRMTRSHKPSLFSQPVTCSFSDDLTLAEMDELVVIPQPDQVTIMANFIHRCMQIDRSMSIDSN